MRGNSVPMSTLFGMHFCVVRVRGLVRRCNLMPERLPVLDEVATMHSSCSTVMVGSIEKWLI